MASRSARTSQQRPGCFFTLVGIGLGGAAAAFGARRLEPLLYEASPILLLITISATARPAWRASRVDPTIALPAG